MPNWYEWVCVECGESTRNTDNGSRSLKPCLSCEEVTTHERET